MRDRLAVLRRLRGPGEWLLLVEVLAVAPLVPLLMRLPLPRVGRLLVHRRPPVARRLAAERVVVVVEAAQRLAHPVVRRGCLTRGIVLFGLLHDRPGDVRLRFGLGGPDDEHFGHCWLERDGVPFLEPLDGPAERFPPVLAFPA